MTLVKNEHHIKKTIKSAPTIFAGRLKNKLNLTEIITLIGCPTNLATNFN